jgi:DNA-binding response OmpR family regulator
MFVRTDDLLPVGDVVELCITLPGGHVVKVISRVAHLLSAAAARALGRWPGMGFEFLELEGEGRGHLMAHLDTLLEEVTPPPQPMPRSVRVLVADESTRLLERLARTLARDGFVVATASNGAEVHAACLANPPDVVLAAADLPGMDGWTLAKSLLGRPSLRDLSLVLMSEDASDMTRLRAYRLGVRDFIHKPFTEEEICIRLRRVAVSRTGPAGVVLRGELSEIGVATLLSLLDFERKSGILVVLRDSQAARLFVATGRVVKVEGPTDDGGAMQRLMAVLDWQDGNFEFASCEVVGQDEVGMHTSALLLEHARVRDEQDAVERAPTEEL